MVLSSEFGLYQEASGASFQREIGFQGAALLPNSQHKSNKVSSRRYNCWNFVPLSVYAQAKKNFMLWYLGIAVLVLTPLSPGGGVLLSTLVPFLVVLCTDIAKKAFREGFATTSLSSENSRIARVWNGQNFHDCQWKDISVGHIVALTEGETAPADLILVTSHSSPAGFDKERITGSRVLEDKQPVKELHTSFALADAYCIEELYPWISRLQGTFKVPMPNPDMRAFRGQLQLPRTLKGSRLKTKNFIPRGYTLRASRWAIGIAVYVGEETKLWQIYKQTSAKTGLFARQNMLASGVLLLVVLTLSVIGFLLGLEYSPYAEEESLDFVDFLVVFNVFMPLAYLIVTEVAKSIISSSKSLTKFGCQVRNSDHLENLGCIDYVFTGQTNCITSPGQVIEYVVLDTTVYNNFNSTYSNRSKDMALHGQTSNQSESNWIPPLKDIELDFKDLFNTVCRNSDPVYFRFLQGMALCNSVNMTAATVESAEDTPILHLAEQLGCTLQYKDLDLASIDLNGLIDYTVCAFQSDSQESRRMRILVQQEGTDYGILYVRGEPSKVLPLLNVSSRTRTALKELLKTQLVAVRHLVYACKFLDKTALEEFSVAYNMARLSPISKEGRVEAVFSEYEKHLDYLGILGIEHHISPKTKECVSRLKNAGIKFWMLTGDSESTAVSSGIGSGIIPVENSLLNVSDIQTEHECLLKLEELTYAVITHNFDGQSSMDDEPKEESDERLSRNLADDSPSDSVNYEEDENWNEGSLRLNTQARAEFDSPKKQHRRILTMALRHLKSTFGQLKTQKIEFNKPMQLSTEYNISLAIEGGALDLAFRSVQTRKLLVILLSIANSAVFYNLMPFQKRQVIRLVKRNFAKKAQVLAVGGDLQDLPMLQESDVSVNLLGRSKCTADIELKEFSKLKYVVLCLGHWTFLNIGRTTAFCFYISCLLGATTFLYMFETGFSSHTLLPHAYQASLTYILLMMPILSIGSWDKDLPSAELINQEWLYKEAKRDAPKYLSLLVEFSLLGLLHGTLAYYFILTSASQLILQSGLTADAAFSSNLLFLGLYFTGLSTLYIQTLSRSIKSMSGFLCSLVAGFTFYIIVAGLELEMSKSLNELLSAPAVFLLLLLVVVSNIVSTVLYLLWNLEYGKFAKKRRLNTIAFINRVIETDISYFYKDSNDWGQAEEKDNFELTKYTHQFKSADKEHNYYMAKLYREQGLYTWYFFMMSLTVALVHLWVLVVQGFSSHTLTQTILSVAGLALFTFLSRSTHLTNTYRAFTLSYFFFLSGLMVALYVLIDVDATYVAPLFFFAVTMSHSIHWTYSMACAGLLCLVEIVGATATWSTAADALELVDHIVQSLSVVLLCSSISYSVERSQRKEFVLQQQLELEAHKVHSVLSCLFPAFVRKRVKDGVRYIAKDVGTVTVVFCNICNFREILEHFSPQELTSFLDETFRKFDHLCDSVGVTKIETVNYTYMACVGLKDSDAEVPEAYRNISHARRAIEFGLLILGAVKNIMMFNGKPLEVKIGIHSGPVAAGVVGSHKPQFSLVGDTVNTASRMASTLSSKNCLQFSQATKHLLKEREGLIFNSCQVQVKGKGAMKVYRISLEDFRKQAVTPQLASPVQHVISKNSQRTIGLHESHTTLRKSTVYKMVEVSNTREFMKAKGIFRFVKNLKLSSFRLNYSKNDETFRKENIRKVPWLFYWGLSLKVAMLFCTNGVLFGSLASDTSSYSWQAHVFVITYMFLYVMMLVLMHRIHLSLLYAWCLQLLALSETGLVLIFVQLFDFLELPTLFFWIVYNALLLTHCSLLLFNEATLLSVLAGLCWLTTASTLSTADFALSAILLCAVQVFLIKSLYSREKKMRFIRNLDLTGHKEIAETEELLVKMFPPQIYNELKNDSIDINKFYSTTLLYADIVGFTAWSSDKSPRQVVEQLSSLFTRFDENCQLHNVYKVHTIGDCYVVMGYDKVKKGRDPGQEALNMVNFAHSLIKVIREVNEELDVELNMRIGMHTGDIVGGITGSNIVRYDIFGTDVLIANEIEANGLAGTIAVSNYTKILLEQFRPSRFRFEKLKEFHCAGENIEVFKLIDSFVQPDLECLE